VATMCSRASHSVAQQSSSLRLGLLAQQRQFSLSFRVHLQLGQTVGFLKLLLDLRRHIAQCFQFSHQIAELTLKSGDVIFPSLNVVNQ